jgi:hypothetical protein
LALSDVCYDFLVEFGEAAKKLADGVHWYSAPDYPIGYGEEIDALRRACRKAIEDPHDPEAGALLLRLAASVMRYHDTPPGISDEQKRQEEMAALIWLLQSGTDAAEASAVPAVVESIVHEGPTTEAAATKVKGILPKLGKATYDTAVKIISDIGSATVKKMLGL